MTVRAKVSGSGWSHGGTVRQSDAPLMSILEPAHKGVRGALIIEIVFSVPGVGSMMHDDQQERFPQRSSVHLYLPPERRYQPVATSLIRR